MVCLTTGLIQNCKQPNVTNMLRMERYMLQDQRHRTENESQLMQTDPRDALPHDHNVEHKGGRSVDVQLPHFLSRVWDKVQEGSTLIFEDTRIPE